MIIKILAFIFAIVLIFLGYKIMMFGITGAKNTLKEIKHIKEEIKK